MDLTWLTEDWIMERVVVCPTTGCWLWTGADSGQVGRGANYPKVKRGSIWLYLHRAVFKKFRGWLRCDLQVDHRCASWVPRDQRILVRRCINPDHLEAVAGKTNQRRRHRDMRCESVEMV